MSRVLRLELEPRWEEIDRVRSETAALVRAAGAGQDAADAVSMVAGELMENANKYGKFTDDSARILLSVTASDAHVTVEVHNPVDAAAIDLAKLDATIQWIRGYQDPFQAYLERVKDVSALSLGSSESGLGLVRIAYEGQSVLDFYLNRHDVLSVSAIYYR